MLFQLPLCYSQDIHFSQYFSTPSILNPALTGQFNGKFRLISNYRNQWRAISRNSYKTFNTSIDAPVYKEKLFAGLSFFNDVAGDSKMSLTQINLPLAATVNLDNNNSLTTGIQIGWAQRSIDISNLTWDSQYDGKTFNKTLSSKESFLNTNFNYFDLSFGTFWQNIISEKIKYNAGIGLFHLNNPKQSFYSDNDKLNSKFIFHSGAEFKVRNSNTVYNPTFMFMKQGKMQEVNIGIMAKYSIGLDSKYTGINVSSSVVFGAFYRLNDAIIPYTRLIYKNRYAIGFSYDINVSRLKVASDSRGGGEISIVYIFSKKNVSVKVVPSL
jgi:type IX secretion system PorP/SprF family membrane protein